MTTLTSYAELKQNILDFSKRKDALGKLDLFIDLCERDIWESMRVREMEDTATLTASTSTRGIALPTGFIKARRLKIQVNNQWFDVEQVTSTTILQSTGIPYQFDITSQIELNVVPNDTYSLELDYYKELDALSSSNTSNAILTNYPKVYLAGSLHHLCQWALMEDKAGYWAQVFNSEVSRANRRARQGRYGPAPSTNTPGMIV